MKVVIVGGGFAGLKLARKLNNRQGFEVTLIDKFNYHQFQPLFYQVATAGLEPSNISFPLRKAFHKSRNVRIRIGEVTEVHTAENSISTTFGELDYDVLVIATGADTNFFSNASLQSHAFPMKSTVEAIQLRHQLIQNFENALLAKDPAELEKLLTIVVVGGGPTGVELSGAIAEMKKFVLPKDYPEIDFSKMKIYLLEGLDRTLAVMSERSSKDSLRYLENLGVTVLTKTIVKDYDGEKVILDNGNFISSRTVIWAAGIKGNVPGGIDKTILARGNRIRTDVYSRVIGLSNVYAIGDIAFMETPEYPNGHPQVAPVAMQQAGLLATNLKKSDSGKWTSFKYFDKGSMATVGRHLAVVDLPKPALHFNGLLAWLIWMGLHLFLILGVKNRLFVFLNWMYNYVTYDQSLRLMFKEFQKTQKTQSTHKTLKVQNTQSTQSM